MDDLSRGLLTLGALFLLGLATATAPAATSDVVHEVRADGKFTRTLLGIVAIDDAIGLIFFSLMLAIENIEWPFMILFFVLAGSSLHLGSLSRIGIIGSAYVILRVVGRLAGAWAGGKISHVDPLLNRWMGVALMPQAGVALGMALVATQRFPELADTILPIVIGATVLFELIGPVLTRKALTSVGEVSIRRYKHQG